jgi:hypothetical protein
MLYTLDICRTTLRMLHYFRSGDTARTHLPQSLRENLCVRTLRQSFPLLFADRSMLRDYLLAYYLLLLDRQILTVELPEQYDLQPKKLGRVRKELKVEINTEIVRTVDHIVGGEEPHSARLQRGGKNGPVA